MIDVSDRDPSFCLFELTENSFLSTDIHFYRSLKVLTFLHSPVDNEAIDLIGLLLQRPDLTLETLEFEHCSIEQSGVQAIASSLQKYSRLESLTLMNCGIDSSSGAALAIALSPSLRYLGLSSNSIEDASVLGPAIAASQLHALDLSHNPLGDAGLAGLLSSPLTALPSSLRLLMLQRTQLSADGMGALASALCVPGLDVVGLADNPLGPGALLQLLPILDNTSCHCSVTSLDLTHTDLTTNACSNLGQLLAALPSLSKLYLSSNSLGDDCVLSLIPFLATHPALTGLDLSYNAIGMAGAAALMSMLDSPQPSKLTSLDLRSNNVHSHVLHSLRVRLERAAMRAEAASDQTDDNADNIQNHDFAVNPREAVQDPSSAAGLGHLASRASCQQAETVGSDCGYQLEGGTGGPGTGVDGVGTPVTITRQAQTAGCYSGDIAAAGLELSSHTPAVSAESLLDDEGHHHDDEGDVGVARVVRVLAQYHLDALINIALAAQCTTAHQLTRAVADHRLGGALDAVDYGRFDLALAELRASEAQVVS